MTHFTEQAIIKAFIELLNEKPLDKITVTAVCERCGINRNTFYYHYPNIYSLAQEMFRSEAFQIVDAHREFNTWQEGFLEATQFARENKTAIYHIYKSVSHERLEEYLFDMAHGFTKEFIERQAEGLDVSAQDLRDLVIIYTVGIEGLVIEWLHTDMKEDAESFIERVSRLFDGVTRFILENNGEATGNSTSSKPR